MNSALVSSALVNSALAALGLVGCLLLARPALAADPADVAAAEALFSEGRELLEAGRYEAACPKLAESQRLDPGTGTALNLAECYEKQGRTATAWGTWLDAATLARQSGQSDREQFARDRARNIESRLHRLVIDVPEASRVEGLRVTRSGGEVRPGAWGTALPVDPGEYVVEATAPGRSPFSVKVTIEPGPGQSQLSIPQLKAEAAAAPAEPPPPVQVAAPPPLPIDTGASSGSPRRTAGIVVTALGAANLAVGGYFGLQAMSLNDESKDHCRTDRLCDARGLDLRNDARKAGTISTILVGVGGALAVTGVVLWVTAPSADAPRVGASTTSDGAQLLLRGDF